MNLRDDPQFPGILSRAADGLGTESPLIEKDYWITQILRLISSVYPNRVIFKGGTSLSKGFSLVDRISEDIDLLIRKESAEDNDETTATLGRGAIDRIMKGITSKCTDAFPMVPTVQLTDTTVDEFADTVLLLLPLGAERSDRQGDGTDQRPTYV
ncbi:MAG: nucleotidyl transferase AbiEii/AbiGii toxin family protein [Acidimicrobiaceae bacterium]|nr:nucleotidyl transferase AbiEii/AbiGii toxin family protein [Acidimicrobiaceae bacterium]